MSNSTTTISSQIRRTAVGLTAALMALLLTGCANCFGWKQLPPSGPRPSAVVLDFPQAPRLIERRDDCRDLYIGTKEVVTERDRRGWWLGSQDIYFNSNWGIIMADLVADQLHEQGVYNLRSRGDVKFYYADKQEIIAQQLGLDGDELDRSIHTLNPVMIGREMGVEKVVVGQVVDAEARKSRVTGPFCSVAAVNVSVYDTATGALEFTQNITNVRNMSTTYGNLEEIAETFATAIKQYYGSRIVPNYTLRRPQ